MSSTAQSRVDSVLRQVDPQHAPKQPLVSITSKANGVAIVTINHPPVNSFSPTVGHALNAVLDECEKDTCVRAVVLTGHGKTFVAGADIPHLAKLIAKGDRSDILTFIESAHAHVDRMEAFPKPIVAAINGDALGGGLELAMACHVRVATAKAKLGLPELKLGVIPGMGGTQRMPRLVGMEEAVKLILSSKSLTGDKAVALGLVDAVVKTGEEAVATASQLALKLATAGKWKKSMDGKVCSAEEARVIAAGARLQTKKNPHLLHPLHAIDAIEAGVIQGGAAGKRVEIEKFVQCMVEPSSKALVHVFLSTKAAGKFAPAAKMDKKTLRTPKFIGVIGGGTMGAGIAVCCLAKGIPVIIKEVNDKAVEGAVERVLEMVTQAVKMMKLPSFAVEHMMRGLTVQTSWKNFDKVGMVIEAAVENVVVKQKIMKDIADAVNKDCIITTNTSTIDIDVVGALLPEDVKPRVAGLHFFSPAPIMPLLEVISGTHTSATTLAVCLATGKAIGKVCILVRSCVGFVANRIFVPYTMAATTLIQAGVSPYRVDKVIKGFGMPMGPFTMMDSVGIDIPMHMRPIFQEGYKGRVYSARIAELLVAAGRIGQKSGQGYYKYVGKKPLPDEQGIAPHLDTIRQDAVTEGLKLPNVSKISDQEIIDICLLPVVNEAFRVIDEKVATETDVDVASILGYGFPPWRGGIVHYGKNREGGLKQCVATLNRLSAEWGQGKKDIEMFFKPCDALVRASQASK